MNLTSFSIWIFSAYEFNVISVRVRTSFMVAGISVILIYFQEEKNCLK